MWWRESVYFMAYFKRDRKRKGLGFHIPFRVHLQ
jgi:hypothetical protein